MDGTSASEYISICLWCGKSTTKKDGREHIFPVGIGGKAKLPLGSVCSDCNNKYSFLDCAFKYRQEAMLMAVQDDPGIQGRIRNRGDKGKGDLERKQGYKTCIPGEGKIKDTKILKQGADTYLINASFNGGEVSSIRGLHKNIANILCNNYGSVATREIYADLLNFVKNGDDWKPWSYAMSHPNPFLKPLISEPRILILRISNQRIEIVSFMHTSGIWVAGTFPFAINADILLTMSEKIADVIGQIANSYGWDWDKGIKPTETFGKLGFKWYRRNESQ